MFRTPSGQTGKTAYTYELAQIMNIHRDLSARMKRLTDAMAEELPEDATYEMNLGTSGKVTVHRDAIREQLFMCGLANTHSYERVTDILRTLKS